MSEIKTVACLGSSKGQPGEPMYDGMMEVGRLLAEKKVETWTGGFGGAGMEAPARGAEIGRGKSVGFIMWGRPGNNHLSYAVDFKGGYREPFHPYKGPSQEVEFAIRLGKLMEADAFILAWDPRSIGTMIELMTIIKLNQALWIPPNGCPKRFAILADSSNADIIHNEVTALSSVCAHMQTIARHIFYDPSEAVNWIVDGKRSN